MATAKLKRKPRLSKFESPIKLLIILKKCSFASSFVSLLIKTHTRNTRLRCCSSFVVVLQERATERRVRLSPPPLSIW